MELWLSLAMAVVVVIHGGFRLAARWRRVDPETLEAVTVATIVALIVLAGAYLVLKVYEHLNG